MAAMDRLDDLQEQVDRLEKWLWKTYNWLKEFYQDFGEETHSWHILKKIDTLKADVNEKLQSLDSKMKSLKKMKAMKGRKCLKAVAKKKVKKVKSAK